MRIYIAGIALMVMGGSFLVHGEIVPAIAALVAGIMLQWEGLKK